MSNSEWTRWQEAWKGRSDPLPDLGRVSKRLARGLWVSRLTFWPMAVAASVGAGYAISQREPWAIADGIIILLVLAAMATWFATAQRRLARLAVEPPLQMIDRFERAGRFGRRASWIGSLAFLAFALLALAQAVWNVRSTAAPWGEVSAPAIVTGVAIVVLALWPRALARIIARRQARYAEWRRQLEEPSAG